VVAGPLVVVSTPSLAANSPAAAENPAHQDRAPRSDNGSLPTDRRPTERLDLVHVIGRQSSPRVGPDQQRQPVGRQLFV
jgi:hypothetical protein